MFQYLKFLMLVLFKQPIIFSWPFLKNSCTGLHMKVIGVVGLRLVDIFKWAFSFLS